MLNSVIDLTDFAVRSVVNLERTVYLPLEPLTTSSPDNFYTIEQANNVFLAKDNANEFVPNLINLVGTDIGKAKTYSVKQLTNSKTFDLSNSEGKYTHVAGADYNKTYNVGVEDDTYYALSLNRRNYVEGEGSTAFGNRNVMVGAYGIVGGNMNVNAADNSFVIGQYNFLSPQGIASLVAGSNNKVLSYASIVTGDGNDVQAIDSLIFGHKNTQSSDAHASLIGGTNNNVGSKYSVVIGDRNNSESSFDRSILVGQQLTNKGYNNALFGHNNTINGNNSLVSGYANVINGTYNFIAGYSNILFVDKSVAIGAENTATENIGPTIFIGHTNKNFNNPYGVVIGDGNYFGDTTGKYPSELGGKVISEDSVSGTTNHNIIVGEGNRIYGGRSSFVAGYANRIGGNYNAVLGRANVFKGYGNLIAGAENKVTDHNYDESTKEYGTNVTADHLFMHGYKLRGRALATFGKWNIPKQNAALIVGNGTNASNRKNIFELYNNGNMNIAGILSSGADATKDTDVPRLGQVKNLINDAAFEAGNITEDRVKELIAEANYVPISISLLYASPSAIAIDETATVTIRWTLNKTAKSQTLNNIAVTGTSKSYSDVKPGTSYTLIVGDEKNKTATRSITVDSYYPVYYGTSENSSISSISGLNKSPTEGVAKEYTINVENNKYVYFVCKETITEIKNESGFAVSFTKQSANISLHGVAYNVYRSDLLSAGTRKWTVK